MTTDDRYRLWEPDGTLAGEWPHHPPRQEMVEGRTLTRDGGPRRDSWRLYGGRLVPELELLKTVPLWPNPLLEQGEQP